MYDLQSFKGKWKNITCHTRLSGIMVMLMRRVLWTLHDTPEVMTLDECEAALDRIIGELKNTAIQTVEAAAETEAQKVTVTADDFDF